MTTTTIPCSNNSGSSKLLLILVFLVLASVIYFAGTKLLNHSPIKERTSSGKQGTAVKTLSYSDHATEKHGPEAIATRNCMKDPSRGASFVYWDRVKDRFLLICEIKKNLFGIQIVARNGHEASAFITDDPTLQGVIHYVENVVKAIRYTGWLPW